MFTNKQSNNHVSFTQAFLRSFIGEDFLCFSRPDLILTAMLQGMGGLFLINVPHPLEMKTLNFVTG